MSEITIRSTMKEITGWTKTIRFEREGDTHIAILYWNHNEGYDITFLNQFNSTPQWALDLLNPGTGDENLYEILDRLTDQGGE
jgi:uncharacterized protein YkuJ